MSLAAIADPGAADVGARIAQIQLMQARLVGGPAAATAAAAPAATTMTTTGSGSFASALASAQATAATPAATATPLDAGTLAPQITAAATKYGIDPKLLTALVKQESGFDPNARSGTGAVGLTQLMPATAAALGVADPTDPVQSLDGGARYLREQLDTFGGDSAKALAAYNAGPGAVQKYGGVPPYAETQNYVSTILADAAAGGSVS